MKKLIHTTNTMYKGAAAVMRAALSLILLCSVALLILSLSTDMDNYYLFCIQADSYVRTVLFTLLFTLGICLYWDYFERCVSKDKRR